MTLRYYSRKIISMAGKSRDQAAVTLKTLIRQARLNKPVLQKNYEEMIDQLDFETKIALTRLIANLWTYLSNYKRLSKSVLQQKSGQVLQAALNMLFIYKFKLNSTERKEFNEFLSFYSENPRLLKRSA